MPDLARIEQALRAAHAAGDTAAATRLAAAYRAAQSAAPVAEPDPINNAAPSIENDPSARMPTGKEVALGFSQGVGNTLANAASIPDKVVNLFGGPERAVSSAFGVNQDDLAALRHPERQTTDYSGVAPNSGARFIGDMVSSAPTFPLGPISGGAASGALTTPEGGDMATSAGIGGGIGALMRVLSGVIAPNVDPSVARLRQAGTTMTPGQIFGNSGVVGRGVKRVEDTLAGLPLTGDVIGAAQNRALETANRGAFNTRALAPIGAQLSPNAVGQDAVREAGDALSANYDALLPQMSVTLDAPFAQTVQAADQRVAARLPDQMGDQFEGTLGDVFKKLNSTVPAGPARTFSGEAAHEAASDLGRMQRSYAPKGGSEGQLGDAFGEVEGAFRDALRRQNPQVGPQLAANDQGWANLVRLEDAAKSATGNASGKLPGVFTGQQLRTAARMGDHSIRDRATARGQALLQDYAEDMIRVLPSSIADSGSAGRIALPALAAGAVPFSAPVAIGAAALPAIYSRPALNVVNDIFARQPGPGRTALADIFRRSAAPAAVAANQGAR